MQLAKNEWKIFENSIETKITLEQPVGILNVHRSYKLWIF